MYSKTSRIVMFGLFLILIDFGQSTITYANWVSMPGTNGKVSALAFDKSGKLYAGGVFDSAGNVRVNHIACWDGSTWNALGFGTNGTVLSLAVDNSGNLYVGGSFDTAGGVRANHIARWNGSSWNAVGSGTNDNLTALAVDDSGHLYSSWWLDTTGNSIVNHIVRWNGSAWSALGSGIEGTIYALVVDHSGQIYVCNDFLIFKWNGLKWETLGGVDMNSDIFTLIVDKSNNLYAGGMNGISGKFINKWNGAAWSTVDFGINSNSNWYVSKLAVDDSGNFYVETADKRGVGVCIDRWNNTSPSSEQLACYVGSRGFPPTDVMCTDSSGNLYIGGSFHYFGGIPVSNIAKYVVPGTVAESRHSGVFGGHTRAVIHDGRFLFSLSQPSTARYEIIDFAGRMLLRSELPVLAAGSHSAIIATGNLCPGVYILDFRAGSQSFKGKFIITK